MTAYYNEIDPYAAQWLRNLIDGGHIARGDVDERSIVDVRADDLKGYSQAHFFAGIGGWSIALRLAGWDDDRPVWTGSCPCQPFSAAGAGKAADDGRHLWPAWFPLIAQRRPPVVFGEQVEAAIGWGWLDAVCADLETEGYACGAAVLPACGVGAPHIRNRLWFVADADGGNSSAEGLQRGREHGQRAQDGRLNGVAHALCDGARNSSCQGLGTQAALDGEDGGLSRQRLRAGLKSATGELGDAAGRGFGEFGDAPQSRRRRHTDGSSILNGFWHDAEWIDCTDGKARPVGPGSFPLGHGIQRRTSKLRAYGNAIVPQVAAQFIGASMTHFHSPQENASE